MNLELGLVCVPKLKKRGLRCNQVLRKRTQFGGCYIDDRTKEASSGMEEEEVKIGRAHV